MIPIRVEKDAKPVLGSDRVIDMVPGHPLADTPCPVCDGALCLSPVVLVFVGIDPAERASGKRIVHGGAVAVHQVCAVGT